MANIILNINGTDIIRTVQHVVEGRETMFNRRDVTPIIISSDGGVILQHVCPEKSVQLKWFEVKSNGVKAFWFTVVEDTFSADEVGDSYVIDKLKGDVSSNTLRTTNKLYKPTRTLTVSTGEQPDYVVNTIRSIVQSPEIYMRISDSILTTYAGDWGGIEPTRDGLYFPYVLADVERDDLTHIIHDSKMGEIKLKIKLPTFDNNNLIL